MRKEFLSFSTALIVAAISAGAHAAGDTISTGYSLITPAATSDQSDVLSVVVVLKLGPDVQSVGQAVDKLLERSGWRVAYGEQVDPAMPTLLALPLPQVHRNLGPIRLRDALRAIAGPSWILVEDPVNRLIAFDLHPRFSPLMTPNSELRNAASK